MTGSTSLKRLILPAVFVLALFAVVIFRGRPDADAIGQVQVFSGSTMGTTFTVKLAGRELDEDAEVLVKEIIARTLDAVDESMSTWRDDSEILALNRASAEEPVAVSEGLAYVVDAALSVAAATGGAFDPTVGPLVRAWGFGADGLTIPPSPDVLQDIRGRVGWHLVTLDTEAGTITKHAPGVELDLSAIAKGYAVDRVFEALVEMGYSDLMVEVGGEVRAGGRAPEGSVWRIGIERPNGIPGEILEVVALDHRAMATSGDYRNYREIDGRRISHTIDPRTGEPIRHGLASVTVISGECMVADAWATALNVLGPDEGPATAEERDLAADFVVRDGDGFVQHHTSAFGNLRNAAGVGRGERN